MFTKVNLNKNLCCIIYIEKSEMCLTMVAFGNWVSVHYVKFISNSQIFLYLIIVSFSLFLLCRDWVISCALSRFWSEKYCLWGWIHRVVIIYWRSFHTVWFVDIFRFCFLHFSCWFLALLHPSWLLAMIILPFWFSQHCGSSSVWTAWSWNR